ncbi:uncharacterized protein LOC119159936 isoform X2 [Rhipicephalus microplus]|uniref:uncharacterized protein LOC119159936 isoform X2 n=1 Tax=Rhipicephalus microplus TaxID=6941 RepID=UPI003F6B417C
MQWLRPTSSPRPSGATSVLNAIRMVNKDKGPTLCIKPCNNYVKDRAFVMPMEAILVIRDASAL